MKPNQASYFEHPGQLDALRHENKTAKAQRGQERTVQRDEESSESAEIVRKVITIGAGKEGKLKDWERVSDIIKLSSDL